MQSVCFLPQRINSTIISPAPVCSEGSRRRRQRLLLHLPLAMFSLDGEQAAEPDSPGSPILLSPSASSPVAEAASTPRNPLLPSDRGNTMPNVQLVDQALANLSTSDGTFDIPLSSPRQQQPPAAASDSAQSEQQQQQVGPAPSARLVVTGVPTELRDEELVRGVFDRFGSIVSVRLSDDTEARRHSAVVEYAQLSSAADAVATFALDGFELNGSKLLVSYAPTAAPSNAQPASTPPLSALAPLARPVATSQTPAEAASVTATAPSSAPIAAPATATAIATVEPLPASTPASAPSAASSAPASSSSPPVASAAPTDVLLHSPQFAHFKAHIPLSRVATSVTHSWTYYEVGPKGLPPLLLLHGTLGSASVFYQQLLALSARGFRVISASWPPYWKAKDWVAGLVAFLDAMRIERAHVFGAGLGGMLALQFATEHTSRVDSLVLCNAFADTVPTVKSGMWTSSLWYMPEFLIKEVMLQSLPAVSFYADAVDFMVAQLDPLTAGDVASRLTINSTQHVVSRTDRIDQPRVLLVLPQDETSLDAKQKERLLQALPNAKQAMMKEGGDYPWLSVPDEVNALLMAHLRSMGCLPVVAEEERTDRVSQPATTADNTPTARALDALKEPASLSRQAMHMFRPAQSAIAGGSSVASAYEAIAEQPSDERALQVVQQQNSAVLSAQAAAGPSESPKLFTRQISGPALTEQTLGETIERQAREGGEEKERLRRERHDSLVMKGEVEERLRVIRERDEEARKKRLHEETVLRLEAEKRRAKANQEAMAQLGIESTEVDAKPRSFKRTSIFDE